MSHLVRDVILSGNVTLHPVKRLQAAMTIEVNRPYQNPKRDIRIPKQARRSNIKSRRLFLEFESR
jgi:hypothetical protein